PVFKYSGLGIGNALRGGGRTLSQSREHHRTRNVLVITQVALAIVLLVSSGLMVRTFQALRDVRPGFAGAPELQTMRISIPGLEVQDPEAVTRMQQAIADKLAAIPGVSSVAFGSSVPMEGLMSADPIFTEDRTYPAGQAPIRRYKYVSPGFLQTMKTRLITGRE